MSDRRHRVIQRGADTDEAEVDAALEQTIEVVVPGEQPLWREQLCALALVDMLGRLFPRIRVVVSGGATADGRLPRGPDSLAERFTAVRAHGLEPRDPGEAVLRVQVGGDDGEVDLYVDGRGWQAYLGASPSAFARDEGPEVVIGPLAAACRGGARVFQQALEGMLVRPHQQLRDCYWSALKYEAGTGPLDEPDVPTPKRIEAVLVGAGSIGGACVYALARTPGVQGELDVVDHQMLEEKNPDRALLATLAEARAEAVKAEVGAAALAHRAGFDARPHKKTIAEFVGERPREATLPLVLSAVDSVASRREIQDCLPLELIDAACSPDEVSISGHRTDDGPCVYCMHVGPLLESEQIRLRLIARATGFAEKMVAGLIVTSAALTTQHLAAIERHRGMPASSLRDREGETLDELWRKELLYGEARVRTSSGGEAAVAAPFVTALAGFLLAGEALKHAAGAAFAAYRLGALGDLPTRYAESPWGSPFDRLLIPYPRWEGHECLCRSGRRLRVLRERYGLE